MSPAAGPPADVPLLDEAAELLGQDKRAARVREQARRVACAQGVPDITAGSRDLSGEVLSVDDLLAARREAPDHQTMAERPSPAAPGRSGT